MTTARKLYSFLGLAKGQFSRWYKSNITENEFAEENSAMKKAADFLKSVKEIIPGI